MTRSLLVRGMLVGIVAGLLVFLSAHWLGEPLVDRAIAFEAHAEILSGDAPEPEMVSRSIQKTAGLITGVLVYGAALGGIFGLVFAYAHGRLSQDRPRVLSALLAAAGFLTIGFVPSIKYPANPPAVGLPETIGVRTAAFFLMILISIAALVLSLQLGRRLVRRLGAWNGFLLGALAFVSLVALVAHFLPVINEVPSNFPADVLWNFRLAAWTMQAVLWTALGLIFGWLTERDPRWSRTLDH